MIELKNVTKSFQGTRALTPRGCGEQRRGKKHASAPDRRHLKTGGRGSGGGRPARF